MNTQDAVITLLGLLSKDNKPQNDEVVNNHPMLNRFCLIRTYSAGVHIGKVVYINPQNSMELKLEDSLRLWKWEGGGLSLSAVANNGIKGGRLNKTGEVYLTNAIEIIPVSDNARSTYNEFIED
tara:strand:- start:61 stop:432 length:372 start_codon:yes stop_codon:yes gene_type:complete